jgi:hypothetical protein
MYKGNTFKSLMFQIPQAALIFPVFYFFATASLATSNCKNASASPEVLLTYVRISSVAEQAGGLMQERKQQTL